MPDSFQTATRRASQREPEPRERLPIALALFFLVSLVPFLGFAGSVEPGSREIDRAPVADWVLERLAESRRVEALILVEDEFETGRLASIDSVPDLRVRRRELVRLLRERASGQHDLRRQLVHRGVEHRPFWIVNALWARIDADDLAWLLEHPDVARVVGNPEVALELPELDASDGLALEASTDMASDAEPGLVHAGAPTFWDSGFTGQGIVVGVADTGVDWDHPALLGAYRGWDGGIASHDYNWHDAIHTEGSICGADSLEPCDDHGHGTHVTGIAVGDDGGPSGDRNLIGMAPGAQWIACRNMDRGNGTPATYLECFEWFLAPTDAAGENPDPDLAPDVVNNSWSCTFSEGCEDSTPVLEEAVDNLRAAGILVVAAAGNSGASCGSIQNPPAIYDAVLTVGSTNLLDQIASSSSRGSGAPGEEVKPDLAAVGVSVRSSTLEDGYGFDSGTSMAAPHVAGAAALLLSACPNLQRRPDSIASYLRSTALPRSGSTCGEVAGSERPNTTFGWGALRMALPEPGACPLFRDGFESGNSAAWQ